MNQAMIIKPKKRKFRAIFYWSMATSEEFEAESEDEARSIMEEMAFNLDLSQGEYCDGSFDSELEFIDPPEAEERR